MQQGEKASKKWVDFSDESEDDLDSDGQKPALKHTQSMPPALNGNNERSQPTVDHRSEQFIQQQLKRFTQAREKSQEIWLLLESEDTNCLDRKIRELKDSGNKDILNIYTNKDYKNAWDVKVTEAIVEKWVKEGIDRDRKIKITVANRNFKGRDHGDRPRGDRPRRERGDRDRGDRGDRRGGDRRGGGRGRRDREGGDRRDNNVQGEKKKVYVDKATGKAPSNKQDVQQQLIQQKQRHYTKTEAERVGLELGNFRNKPKVDNPPEQKVEQPREVREVRKPKEEMKAWTRKDTKEEKKEEERIDKKIEYREKPQEEVTQPEKKKTYVRVDNLTEKEKEQLKQKKPKNNNGLLSEDSN